MKNLSIAVKLTIATVILAVVSVLILVFSTLNANDAITKSEKVYYQQLYTIDNLLVSADRDYYQALSAELEYLSRVSKDGKEAPDSAAAESGDADSGDANAFGGDSGTVSATASASGDAAAAGIAAPADTADASGDAASAPDSTSSDPDDESASSEEVYNVRPGL